MRIGRILKRHAKSDPCAVFVLGLTAALTAATGALVWVGYRATEEWEHSLTMLVDRQADETLALLAAAINRDMKAAQLSVLVPINHEALVLDPPFDLATVFARAFARFPYPESFFAWKPGAGSDGLAVFFNRADRPPPWAVGVPHGPYPVVIHRNLPAARTLIDTSRQHARYGKPFALFDADLGGARYQTVVHLLYNGTKRGELYGLVGFTVNLAWVRHNYFSQLTTQVARIGGEPDSMSLTVLDEVGRPVASAGPPPLAGPPKQRSFPLLFFDPSLLSSLPTDESHIVHWRARVLPGREPTFTRALAGAKRTLWFLAVAALVTILALVLTARTVRVAARLASIRSEFVSTVTHELKTPLASIRLVGETLNKGRYRSVETIREYAALLSHQAQRLTMLVDNLLMYGRITDAKQLYSFEPLRIGELAEEAVETFHPLLAELGFEVQIDVPGDLPAVRGDRRAIVLLLENLIDNGLKYSDGQRTLAIRVCAQDTRVRVEVTDRGIGISEQEIPKLFEKYYRAHNATKPGSGLGLAIARQIVEDHGGRIAIRSRPGQGTTVAVTLPAESRPCASAS